MIDAITHWLSQQLQTGVFAGGAALGLAGGTVATLHRLVPRLWNFILDQVTTTITIDSRSAAFQPMILWLHHHPYTRHCRRLQISTTSQDNDDGSDPELIFSPADGRHCLSWKGRPIWLERRKGKEGGDDSPFSRGSAKNDTLRLTLLGRDRHELRHLIANAMKKHGRPDPNYTQIYGLAEYLEWEKLARIRKRPLASVILPRGVVENVIKDATRFLEGAEWHAERGIPWRRGYLLYGPPGTGKTSLVKSLAGALGLDLAIINLTASRLDDQSLSGLFAGAPARSILLIEDIDAAFAQRDRDDAGRGITFSGLLNAIDGVASQEGHLLFMTTNHIERLDPALIRPGRVDMRIPFGLLDQTLALRMFGVFFPGRPDLEAEFRLLYGEFKKSAASLQSFFLCHRDGPEAALRELRAWLTQDSESAHCPEEPVWLERNRDEIPDKKRAI